MDQHSLSEAINSSKATPNSTHSDVHGLDLSAAPPALTKLSLMSAMHMLWHNERVCFDILPYDKEVVEGVIREINEREEAAQGKPLPDTTLPFNPFDVILYELSRAKYVMADYLRIRLEKISACIHTLLGDEVRLRRLSPQEKQWATTYAQIEHTCMLENGLANLPVSLRRLTPNPPLGEGSEIHVEPPKHHYVFVRVLQHVGQYDIGGTIQELSKGDLYVLQYAVVESLLLSGKVQLL
ncbi:hypothetical protein XU18_1037 [Perkinsela sp. CCAP 1560/4]|nr:hypothetical protein XU18_1037 [Perkinsela sp. CCAP 1560/4]|eukprot:KNH08468.1 hypothetical protein XU18_1037 [Perkinsela sp. CCAP 1560/4]